MTPVLHPGWLPGPEQVQVQVLVLVLVLVWLKTRQQ